MSFSRNFHNCKNEMALSDTAGAMGGGTLSPHRVQNRALVAVLGAKPPGASKILYIIVHENELKIDIFPVCCSTKTQDKVLKIAT